MRAIRSSWFGVLPALVAVLASTGQAQVDRSKRPVAPPPAPFAFPHVATRTLSNGMRVAVVENHALPIVAVRLVLPVDSLADPRGKEGTFSLMLSMMRDGTTSRTAEQLAAAMSEVGTAVFPTGFTTIAANFEPALALTADMVMHPAFSQSDLAGRQAARVASVQRQLQSQITVPRRIMYSLLFGPDHPLARAANATEESARAVTLDDVKQFHARYIGPQNLTLVIAGDVRAADAYTAATRAFGAWRRGESVAAEKLPAPPAPQPTTIYLFDRPGATQSNVAEAQIGPAISSNDYTALTMMGSILGASQLSRLMQNLRGRHAYVYSAALTQPLWRNAPEPSLLQGLATFPTAKTDSAMIEWVGELRAIRSDRPPTDDEMAAARAALITALPTQIETMDGVADRVAFLARNNIPFDFDNRVAKAAAGLTSADIARVAKTYLDPAHTVFVVAGDRKVIEPALRATNIGPVVIVDENGRRVP